MALPSPGLILEARVCTSRAAPALLLLLLQFGYTVYRRVIGYYSNEEDAFGECAGLRCSNGTAQKSCRHPPSHPPPPLSPLSRPADMRKAMPRDVQKQSVVPLSRPVYPHELEHD